MRKYILGLFKAYSQIFVRSSSFICIITKYNDGCIKPYIRIQISKLYQVQIYHTIALKFVQHLKLTCQRAFFNNDMLKLCYYIQRQHFVYLSTTLFHKWYVLVNHKVYGFNMKNIKLLRFIRLKILFY